MGKSKHHAKKRGGTPIINRNGHPMENQMPVNQMPVNQMPNNNCPPCVCPSGTETGENNPTSLKDKVLGFNQALATKPGEWISMGKSKTADAFIQTKDEYLNKISGFLKPVEKTQPEINVGGRRRRTRRKRQTTKRKSKRRRGTKRRVHGRR